MNRMPMSLVCMMACLSSAAQSYMESYDVASNQYSNKIEDIKIIRNINGGTVILPDFDESCPEELKSPFCYACKIVEEYMPPSLPIRVKVSADCLTGQFADAVSKIRTLLKENFGYDTNKSTSMARIKSVLLAEYATDVNITYMPFVPDVSFLTDEYDIEITYNDQFLIDMSFSLEPAPENHYDFVSLAIRNLLKGLGLNSGFKYNKTTKGLDNPSRPFTFFEDRINEALGENNTAIGKFNNATKGELKVPKGNLRTLSLYAPETWTNGVSLNYFVPQADCDVSNILAPDFYKGTVYRSVNDSYHDLIFEQLLGWEPDRPSGEYKNEVSSQGSTSMLMPYLGSFNPSSYSSVGFNTSDNNFTSESGQESPGGVVNGQTAYSIDADNELTNYLETFHPFLTDGIHNPSTGTSISILKKDGTWDLMELRTSSSTSPLNMSDWTLHYDESEYARTIDGYLRGRITYKRNGYYGTTYDSKFFVIDYLPQKVSLKCKVINSENISTACATQAVTLPESVRIYFSNTEGVDQIILERLKQGSRIPNKIPITDFQKGYYDTTIDRTTTFTAVAYNKNGSSRGLPVTIVPTNTLTLSNQFTINVTECNIQFKSDIASSIYSYEIRSLDSANSIPVISGSTTETVDISELSEGNYVISVLETTSNTSKTKKFRKS